MGFFGGGGGAAASNMVGATSSAAGTAGLVPAPAAGEQNGFLMGQGIFGPAVFRPNLSTYSRFYGPMGGGLAFGDTNGATANAGTRAELNPILLPSGSVSKLGIFVVSSIVNATGYLALYGSDSSGNPAGLITSGSFSYTSSDTNVTKTVTISPSVAIKAGLYYTAHHANGNLGSSNSSIRKTNRGNFLNSFYYGYEDENNSFNGGQNAGTTINISSAGTWPNPAGTLSFGVLNMVCVYVYVS
jgi:hypothetical protein